MTSSSAFSGLLAGIACPSNSNRSLMATVIDCIRPERCPQEGMWAMFFSVWQWRLRGPWPVGCRNQTVTAHDKEIQIRCDLPSACGVENPFRLFVFRRQVKAEVRAGGHALHRNVEEAHHCQPGMFAVQSFDAIAAVGIVNRKAFPPRHRQFEGQLLEFAR